VHPTSLARTAFLLAAIVGSGIIAERLSGGNVGIALLCNSLATGAMLVVLITIFGPVSGAAFSAWLFSLPSRSSRPA